MRTIISTIGISLYSNLLKGDVVDFFQENYNDAIITKENFDSLNDAELTADKYSENYFQPYEESIFEFWMQNIDYSEDKGFFKKSDIVFHRSCAELSTLQKIEGYKESKHQLLTTDSAISWSAAKLIKRFLIEKSGIDESNIRITRTVGLQVNDFEKYNTGINNLIEKILEIKKNSEVILNISGGFKAITPILTIIAQLEGIKLNYIYEDSDELIEIPAMPLDFDFSLIEENYLAFEGIKPDKSVKNLPLIADFKNLLAKKDADFNELINFKIIEEFDYEKIKKIRLALLGKLLFNKYEELYNKNIFSRQKLLSEVIEYKIFEYFIKTEKNAEVIKGKKVGDEGFDLDIFIGRKKSADGKYEEVEIIEVKPGGYVPIWKKANDNNTIEYRLKEGSFKWVIENKKADKYIFNLIAYYHVDLNNSVINQVENLYKSIKENKNIELKLTLLKVRDNYKKNVDWKVDKNMLKQINLAL